MLLKQQQHQLTTRSSRAAVTTSSRVIGLSARSVCTSATRGRRSKTAGAETPSTAADAAAPTAAAAATDAVTANEEQPLVRSSRGRRGPRQGPAIGAIDVLADIRGKLIVEDPDTGCVLLSRQQIGSGGLCGGRGDWRAASVAAAVRARTPIAGSLALYAFSVLLAYKPKCHSPPPPPPQQQQQHAERRGFSSPLLSPSKPPPLTPPHPRTPQPHRTPTAAPRRSTAAAWATAACSGGW